MMICIFYECIDKIIDHISQRMVFTKEIIKKGIKSEDIMFTDECRIMLFPKINPKINVIRLSDEDKKKSTVLKSIKKEHFWGPNLK